MKELLSLIGYEYKKIGKRRFVWAALATVLAGALVWGLPRGDAEIEEKGVASQCYMLLEGMLGKVDYQGMDDADFYHAHAQMLEGLYQSEKLSSGEIAFHRQELSQVEKPFFRGGILGFEKYFSMQGALGLAIAFVVAICLAPIFSNEYASHMDALILTSRYGKNKAILAKLLTGFTLAVGITVLCLGAVLLELSASYGFHGWDLPVQACRTGFPSSIPIHMLQMLGISVGCAVSASCLVAAVVMFCSAKIKSSFRVIIVSMIFILLPELLIYTVYEKRPWFMFMNSMPASMMYPGGLISCRLFSIGGHYLYFFQAVPVAYLFFMVVFGVWGHYCFRNHQVSSS